MKKILVVVLLLLTFTTLALPIVAADGDELYVYVSITDGDNKLAYAKVKVLDKDGNGEFSVHDALYYAHVWYYEGGATAGYKSVPSAQGLRLTKLWGKENGSGYGYYVNDVAADSLEMSLKENDHVHAFVYQDTVNGSDTYSYFDKIYFQVEKDESVTLTLMAATFDENRNPVKIPVTDAYITLNGEKTDFRTDENGKVTITFEKGGKTLVGAVSDSMNLVNPSCLVRVEGGFTMLGFVILLLTVVVGFLCFGAWYLIVYRKKKA